MNYLDVLANPVRFFKSIEKKQSYKSIILIMFIFVFIIELLVNLRHILSAQNIPRSIGIQYTDLIYQTIDSFFFSRLSLIIFGTSILLMLTTFAGGGIVKLIARGFKKDIPYKLALQIVTYSHIIIIFQQIYLLLKFILNLPLPDYLNYLFDFYAFYFVFIAIYVFFPSTKNKIKKVSIAFIVITISFFAYLVYDSITEADTQNHNFTAKIGNETLFTEDDIVSVCRNIKCSNIYPDSYCFERDEGYWSCSIGFSIDLNEDAEQRFVDITKDLNDPGVLYNDDDSEFHTIGTIEYYLDGELIGDVAIAEELRGIPQKTIHISAYADAET